MPGGGAKPGERRGGRKKGTPNKATIAKRRTQERISAAVEEAPKPPPASTSAPAFDSLENKRIIVIQLMALANDERRKRAAGEKWDPKWFKECLEAADRSLTSLLPYEHRRLATLEPAMETVVRPDGSVHVTISKTDSEL